MTTLALNGYQPFARTVNTGSSPESRRVQEQTEAFVKHFRHRADRERVFEELDRVTSEASATGWDGYRGNPSNLSSYQLARRFLASLPTTLPVPEVAIDPDGDIGFDWYLDSKHLYTVSIGANGRLAYAGVFGSGARTHGTEVFDDNVPEVVIQNISRVFRRR